MSLTLPTDSQERKEIPVFSGVLKYAPAALAGVARISKLGNDKHNPGEPLHHARGKSSDHGDCVIRHVMDVADIIARLERLPLTPGTGEYESEVGALLAEASQLSWRALMWSQELHERYGDAPLAPGAKLPTPPVLAPLPTTLPINYKQKRFLCLLKWDHADGPGTLKGKRGAALCQNCSRTWGEHSGGTVPYCPNPLWEGFGP